MPLMQSTAPKSLDEARAPNETQAIPYDSSRPYTAGIALCEFIRKFIGNKADGNLNAIHVLLLEGERYVDKQHAQKVSQVIQQFWSNIQMLMQESLSADEWEEYKKELPGVLNTCIGTAARVLIDTTSKLKGEQ